MKMFLGNSLGIFVIDQHKIIYNCEVQVINVFQNSSQIKNRKVWHEIVLDARKVNTV